MTNYQHALEFIQMGLKVRERAIRDKILNGDDFARYKLAENQFSQRVVEDAVMMATTNQEEGTQP